MFKDCGGMFAVADHYYSFILSHQQGHISTIYLFLPEEAMPCDDSQQDVKDYRARWADFTKLAGESFVNVKTPCMLIKDISFEVELLIQRDTKIYRLCQGRSLLVSVPPLYQ
jgi:hypothetical protein